MKKSVVLLTVALLLVFGIVQVATAAGMGWGGGGPRMQNGGNCMSPVQALDLTDQQIAKMQQIKQDTYQQTRELKIQLMDKMQELRMLQLQKNPDQAKVDAKIKEINDLRAKLSGIVQESRQQCQSLLTKEQLEKMNQYRGQGRGCGFGKGFGPGMAGSLAQ